MARRDEGPYVELHIRELIRQRSVTEEQRSQSAYENPRGGGSFVCGLR